MKLESAKSSVLKSFNMSKMSTNFVPILVLSTIHAKPASNEDSSSSEKSHKRIFGIIRDCRSEFNLDEISSEIDEKNIVKAENYSCYLRCMYDKLGLMRNNTIDEKEMSKSLDVFIQLDPNNAANNKKIDEIFTNCVKNTNSKNYEDKCEPLKDFAQCIDTKTGELSKLKKQ